MKTYLASIYVQFADKGRHMATTVDATDNEHAYLIVYAWLRREYPSALSVSVNIRKEPLRKENIKE